MSRPGRLPAFPAAPALALAALLFLPAPILAWNDAQEGPLTQADIDAYIFLAPRLLGEIINYPDQAAKVLAEANLTRRRAIYITAKIPLIQVLARGLVSPSRLMNIPGYLHPSTEEVQLVNANLMTLMQAESAAIDVAGVSVPRKWREVSRPWP